MSAHVSAGRRIARESYADRRWRRTRPLSRRKARAIRYHVACLERRRDRRAITVYAKRRRERLRRWRRFRRVTPEPGLAGEGRWLRHLAIPAYVVRCETRGRTGMARYRVRGGGAGAYQIQDPTWRNYGGTRFAPTADRASPTEQATIARSILAVQGPSAWACW